MMQRLLLSVARFCVRRMDYEHARAVLTDVEQQLGWEICVQISLDDVREKLKGEAVGAIVSDDDICEAMEAIAWADWSQENSTALNLTVAHAIELAQDRTLELAIDILERPN